MNKERRKFIKRFSLGVVGFVLSSLEFIRKAEAQSCYTNCFCHCDCYCNCYTDCYSNCYSCGCITGG